MTTVAVTGHKGYIGSALVKHGYTPLECDVTNLDEVNDALHSVNPDVIIHCAALTDVDYCEDKDHVKEAFAVNTSSVNNLLHSFIGTLVYPSTVHVFNGRKYFDYAEHHTPSPLSIYGFTKWAGEQISRFGVGRSLVVRISKVFSWETLSPFIYQLDGGIEFQFPTFIRRSFVYLPHFIDGFTWTIEHMDEFPDVDLMNLSGTDTLSYYQFWQLIAEAYGISDELIFPRKTEIDLAPRPYRGGLSVRLAKSLGVPLYSAIDGIKEMTNEENS